MDLKVDNTTKELISSKAKSKIIFLNIQRRREENNQDKEISKKDLSDVLSNSTIESAQDNKFVDLTKKLFELDKDIRQFESKAKTRYRGVNKFLENL